MARQYGQYGYERPREGQREPWRDSEHYGGEESGTESNRKYRGESGAPLEWDDRQYERDFDEYPRQGGRSVYSGGRGAQQYGQNFESEQGRGNYGGTRYGGSDYQNGDFSRNESRYGDPYSSSQRDQRGQFGGGDRWSRSRGSEWSPQNTGQSTYDDQNSGRAYDDYYRGQSKSLRTGQPSSGQYYPGQSGAIGQSGNYGPFAAGQYGPMGQHGGESARAYEDRSYRGQMYGQQRFTEEPYQAQGYQGQSYQSEYQGAYQGSNFGSSPRGNSYLSSDYTDSTYRGKGPKGYERSEERVKEIICEALTEAPHIDASEINIEVKNKEVKLTGSVKSRQMKFAAEELVESKVPNCEVKNELRVRSGENSLQGSQRGGSEYGYSQSVSRGGSMSGESGAGQASSGYSSGTQTASSQNESRQSSTNFGSNQSSKDSSTKSEKDKSKN